MNRSFWAGSAHVGEVVYPPGGTFGPRFQSSFQLVLMHSGHVTVWIDGQEHHTSANTIFLLFPDHEEHFVFAPECETWHTWLNVPTLNVDETLSTRLKQLAWALPLSPTMNQLLRSALLLQQIPFPTSRELLLTLGMQMLWRYLGEGELQLAHTDRQASPTVEQAQHFLSAHLGETLSLHDIARAVAVSPAHLIRLFHAQLHTTPMTYLWNRRVARGIELLEHTGMSVGAIAVQCGFQSRFHFSRRVREAVGYTPLEVRQRSWQRALLSEEEGTNHKHTL